MCIPTPMVRSDPRFGYVVAAPSPEDRDDPAWFCVDPVGTIRRIIESGLADRFAEYEGLVHGGIPGGTGGLMMAVALFRGLQRPMRARGQDKRVLVYVMNPSCTYTYPVPHRIGIDPPTRRTAYPNCVFVAYGDASDDGRRRATELARQAGFEEEPIGLVTNWEWVLRSQEDQALPDNYSTRYLERKW